MPPTLIDLYADPCHVQTNDSHLWLQLFRNCIASDKLQLVNWKRVELLTTLHQFRSLGTVIRGGKLTPLIHPNGKWASQAEYDEFKDKFLRPYVNELKILLQESEAS